MHQTLVAAQTAISIMREKCWC